MKLSQAILFGFGTGFFLIAIHQSMTNGFAAAYWLYMLSIGLLLWFKMRKDAYAKKQNK